MINPYNKLTPFKWFVLQNFPFIEEDFDAITEYQLLCKVVEYLNKTIDKTNELGEEVEKLNTWFNNLDVQEEVNNKLNEMAEDGTLAEIINEQIFSSLNTEIQNLDEKIDNTKIELENEIESNTERIENLENEYCIFIADSYGGVRNDVTGWNLLLPIKMGLSSTQYLSITQSGAGFVAGQTTFLEALQNHISEIPDLNKVTKIFVCGGDNDRNETTSDIETAIRSFINYVQSNMPNAHVYIGMIGYSTDIERRKKIMYSPLIAYSNIAYSNKKATYLNGVEFGCTNKTWFQEDGVHPTQSGANKMTESIYQAYKNGFSCNISGLSYITVTVDLSGTITNNAFYTTTQYDSILVGINLTNMTFGRAWNISAGNKEPTLGTYVSNYLMNEYVEIAEIPTLVEFRDGNDNIISSEPCLVRLRHDGVISLLRLTPTNAISNIEKVIIYPCSKLLPRRLA